MFNDIMNLIKRSIVKSKQAKKNFLTCQIDYMGFLSETEVVYPYGMIANAQIGYPAVTLSVGAQEDNKVSMPYTFAGLSKLPVPDEGEVVIGNPVVGSYIRFLKNGEIEINGKTTYLDDIIVPDAIINMISSKDHRHTNVPPSGGAGFTSDPRV